MEKYTKPSMDFFKFDVGDIMRDGVSGSVDVDAPGEVGGDVGGLV